MRAIEGTFKTTRGTTILCLTRDTGRVLAAKWIVMRLRMAV
jgi:hypothetical protein